MQGNHFRWLANVPWPVVLFAGAAAAWLVRYGLPWYFARFGGEVLVGFANPAVGAALAPLAGFILMLSIAAAWISARRRSHRAWILQQAVLQGARD